MLIIIIVKKDVMACFGDVQATSVGAGLLGLMGNKGATAIRLVYSAPLITKPSSESSPPHSQSTPGFSGHPHSITRPVVLTFVNSHLAAFDEMYDRRNADFNDLSRRISFDSGIPIQDPATAPEGYPPPTVPLSVYQSDALFWMVYLNYRINLPDADVRTLLAEQSVRDSLALLQQYDQLKLAMRTKKAFVDFTEPDITHLPSYRFNAGLMTDDIGYDMKRKPAWTDRVLYMSSPVAQVEQLSYSSHPEITMSDHKPVSADFIVHVPIVHSDKLDSFVRSLWRDVMDMENSEEIPKIKLNTSAFDFGKVFYRRTVTQVLELSNVGKVPCAFRFVPITEGAPVHPEWMKVMPMSGLIRPGENIQVVLVAEIDNENAQKLNASSSRLDDTLILHTSLGKDHFIAISGQYQRTCFATSLEQLVRLSGPARSLDGKSGKLEEDAVLNAPQEVMKLINWLMSNATEVKNLFLLPGDPNLIAEIRECLDTGADLDQPSQDDLERHALSVATCLVELLSSLPESLIPITLQSRCAHVASRDEAFELLDNLPSASVNVWISITAFLHFVNQQTSDNEKNRTSLLADIFSPILMRDNLDVSAPISPISKRRFLLFFMTPG
ncbi:hypothetical protein QCA50_016639 [Cerrena zonata]|uniref:Rho-GAP domain-containing protein n=1 Tax=Cerrena zonata TaxID=2478898 RepID=A0AAW0FLF5_9APHY